VSRWLDGAQTSVHPSDIDAANLLAHAVIRKGDDAWRVDLPSAWIA